MTIAEREIELDAPVPVDGTPERYKPWFAQGDLMQLFPEIAIASDQFNLEEIGLEITPLSPDLRIWAFVSVTNNETQHVTVIAP